LSRFGRRRLNLIALRNALFDLLVGARLNCAALLIEEPIDAVHAKGLN
jgi:hypothetical protein